MKRSKYHFFEELSDAHYLHYSPLSNSFLLLNKEHHETFVNAIDMDCIQNTHSFLYENLLANRFIVEDDFDELQYVFSKKKEMVTSTDLYNLVINTTLDCNLNCWYCYENKIAGSKLSPRVIEAVKRNIALQHEETNYTVLKLSFFGGEPFLCFDEIKQILDYARYFCLEHNIELIADFTTNATLITKGTIDYLKQYRCHFQITLDGGRDSHNKIKINLQASINNSYDSTLEALRLIEENIERSWVAVRINFDNHTLQELDEIIEDIKFLDRRKTYVILKKIWQLKTEKVNKEALMSAIQSLFDKKFLVDYYIMPKGCVCFAERKNQVLINYDGKIFKCTTISDFDEKHTLGKLDYETGAVCWDETKTETWFAEMQSEYCKACKWFPVCLGICNRQLLAHKTEKICTFDSCNLTEKEYLIYLFKYNLLRNEISK